MVRTMYFPDKLFSKKAELYLLRLGGKKSLRQTSTWNGKCQSEQLECRNLQATKGESGDRKYLDSLD